MADLKGKVGIVTGGGSGIGKATALAMARTGAALVIGNRNAAKGEEIVGLIRQAGGRAVFQKTDVSKLGDVRGLVERAVKEFGRIFMISHEEQNGHRRLGQHDLSQIGNPCSHASLPKSNLMIPLSSDSMYLTNRLLLLDRRLLACRQRRVTMAVTNTMHFHRSLKSSTNEHFVMLMSARRFDRLLLKDDFLDEGVAAVFGLAGEEVELLGLSFHAEKFSPSQIAAWLAERRLTPSVDVPLDAKITDNNQSP